MTVDGVLSVGLNFHSKDPFTQSIFVVQLNAIFVAPKLYLVSNRFETTAISRRFYRRLFTRMET